jgi:hypothetical protein
MFQRMAPAALGWFAALAALTAVAPTVEAQCGPGSPPCSNSPIPSSPSAHASAAPAPLPAPRWGLHNELGATVVNGAIMGGVGAYVRLRPASWFGLDLGLGAYTRITRRDGPRLDAPITASALLFLNPQDALQFYVLGGVGISYSSAQNDHLSSDPHLQNGAFWHVGGQLGLGVEWRIARQYALNTDVRGLLRTRVAGSHAPQSADPDTGVLTNTPVGVYWTLGWTVYY